jgi:hypothetical protein
MLIIVLANLLQEAHGKTERISAGYTLFLGTWYFLGCDYDIVFHSMSAC